MLIYVQIVRCEYVVDSCTPSWHLSMHLSMLNSASGKWKIDYITVIEYDSCTVMTQTQLYCAEAVSLPAISIHEHPTSTSVFLGRVTQAISKHQLVKRLAFFVPASC